MQYHPVRPLRTAIFKTREGSMSKRTTIPEFYVRLLRLTDTDKLEWDHEIIDDEIVLKIRKARQ